MKLLNSCQTQKRDIAYLTWAKGERVNFQSQVHQIRLVLRGKMTFSLRSENKYQIVEGQFFFLPRGMVCSFCCEEKTEMFCVNLPDIKTILEELYPEGVENKKKSLPEFNVLACSPLVNEYTRHLAILLQHGAGNDFLKETYSYYLLLLLKISYPESIVCELFSSVLETRDLFMYLVLAHYENSKSIADLAAVCNQSIRTFERHFKQSFGQPPGKWLLQKRIEGVYHEIVRSNKPLIIIADKYKFSSLSNFSDFCKKYIGFSPTQLRKK